MLSFHAIQVIATTREFDPRTNQVIRETQVTARYVGSSEIIAAAALAADLPRPTPIKTLPLSTVTLVPKRLPTKALIGGNKSEV